MGLFDFFKKGKAEKVAEEIKEAAEQIADAVEDAVEDIAEVVSGEEEAAPESTGNALMDMIYGGSDAVIGLTEGAVNAAIEANGADAAIAFPDTAYFFPTIYAATGVKVEKLGDLPACVEVM